MTDVTLQHNVYTVEEENGGGPGKHYTVYVLFWGRVTKFLIIKQLNLNSLNKSK